MVVKTAHNKELTKPLLGAQLKNEKTGNYEYSSSLLGDAVQISSTNKFSRMNTTAAGLPTTVDFEFEDANQEDGFMVLGASADGFLNPQSRQRSNSQTNFLARKSMSKLTTLHMSSIGKSYAIMVGFSSEESTR